MEFDPNSNPPCYKTVDEVSPGGQGRGPRCPQGPLPTSGGPQGPPKPPLFPPQDIVIQQDDEIRLKIVGTRVDKNDIVSGEGNAEILGGFQGLGGNPKLWGRNLQNLGGVRVGFGWEILNFRGKS